MSHDSCETCSCCSRLVDDGAPRRLLPDFGWWVHDPRARHRRADLTPSKGEVVACDRAGFAKSRVFADHLCLLQ